MQYPYFKLAAWDARNLCFRDGKTAHALYDDARAAAKTTGRYRISRIDVDGRTDMEPFDVAEKRECKDVKDYFTFAMCRPMPITRPPVGFRVIRRR